MPHTWEERVSISQKVLSAMYKSLRRDDISYCLHGLGNETVTVIYMDKATLPKPFSWGGAIPIWVDCLIYLQLSVGNNNNYNLFYGVNWPMYIRRNFVIWEAVCKL